MKTGTHRMPFKWLGLFVINLALWSGLIAAARSLFY